MTTKTRLNTIARRLERRAPAEPVVIHVVYHDEATGEDEPAGEVAVDGREVRVIQLHWPEDEDDEKATRDVAPGRAQRLLHGKLYLPCLLRSS